MYLIKMLNSRYVAHVQLRHNDAVGHALMVVDTGAATSHLSNQVAHQFRDLSYTGKIKNKGGIVRGVRREFYEAVFDITIGDIHLSQQNIFVAQDSDIAVSLLGIDILSQLRISQIDNSYLIALRSPIYRDSGIWVTNSNIEDYLLQILKDKARASDISFIRPLLPNFIDMSYTDLQKLVEQLLRYKSIKRD